MKGIDFRAPASNLADPPEFGRRWTRTGSARKRRGGRGITEGEIAAWERSKAGRRPAHATGGPGLHLLTGDCLGDGVRGGLVRLRRHLSHHMWAASGLSTPCARRFDLINPDCSPLLLGATALEREPAPARQHPPVHLPVRRGATARPVLGGHARAVGSAAHGDRQPTAGVGAAVDLRGEARDEPSAAQLTLGVGCGGHTPYGSDLVQAEPGLTLEAFRQALSAGARSPGVAAPPPPPASPIPGWRYSRSPGPATFRAKGRSVPQGSSSSASLACRRPGPCEDAFRDDFTSVAEWEARPDWLGTPARAAVAEVTDGVAHFAITEPDRGLSWPRVVPDCDTDLAPWLVIRYRVQGMPPQGGLPALAGGCRGWTRRGPAHPGPRHQR